MKQQRARVLETLFSKQRCQPFTERHLPFSQCWRNGFISLMKYYALRRTISSCLLFLRSIRKHKNARTDAYVAGMSDSSFTAVSVAMFVVCLADKPRDIIRTKLPQMERKSETSFSYQSEQSTFGGGLFRFQSEIGLPINGTGNLIFHRKIRF